MRTAKIAAPWALRVIGLVSLLCTPTGALAYYWTDWASEEDGDLLCGEGEGVHGFGCSGDYCDSVQLLCVDVGAPTVSNYYWSPYISEETGGFNTNKHVCRGPGGELGIITGVSCDGDYCDNISVRCSRLNVTINPSSCSWRNWLSEEQGFFIFQTGPGFSGILYFAAGVECRGDYCDDKRFYTCPLR